MNQTAILSTRRQALAQATSFELSKEHQLFAGPILLHPISMTRTQLSRVIPLVTSAGTLDLPLDACDRIGSIVVDDFDAELAVIPHPGRLEFDGDEPVPVPPHLHLELSADEDIVDELLAVIDPLIEELIAEYTLPVKVPVAS